MFPEAKGTSTVCRGMICWPWVSKRDCCFAFPQDGPFITPWSRRAHEIRPPEGKLGIANQPGAGDRHGSEHGAFRVPHLSDKNARRADERPPARRPLGASANSRQAEPLTVYFCTNLVGTLASPVCWNSPAATSWSGPTSPSTVAHRPSSLPAGAPAGGPPVSWPARARPGATLRRGGPSDTPRSPRVLAGAGRRERSGVANLAVALATCPSTARPGARVRRCRHNSRAERAAHIVV